MRFSKTPIEVDRSKKKKKKNKQRKRRRMWFSSQSKCPSHPILSYPIPSHPSHPTLVPSPIEHCALQKKNTHLTHPHLSVLLCCLFLASSLSLAFFFSPMLFLDPCLVLFASLSHAIHPFLVPPREASNEHEQRARAAKKNDERPLPCVDVVCPGPA